MMNNATYKDFIAVYDNALSSEECSFALAEVQKAFLLSDQTQISFGEQQFNSRLRRHDYGLHGETSAPNAADIVKLKLHECVMDYADKFFSIREIQLASLEVKFQKTPKLGGYHLWHYEADCIPHAKRVLAWLVYLNDIGQNEGETEFFYQNRRIEVKAGRCVIWPAAFTHTHKGNLVHSQDKYVATGWYTMTA